MSNLVNMIFGLKVRQARTEAGLSVSAFAEECDLSVSYVTEIEKGSKHPRADKILKMAEVLGKDYDELVSIKLAPSLKYLETTLSSSILHQFPFEEFGVDLSDLVKIFTRAPVKASAFLHTILNIGRQYDMKEEHFLLAALRSYQEIHENYFQDLEGEAAAFAERHALSGAIPVQLAELMGILETEYGYALDDTRLATHKSLSGYRSVFVEGKQPKLLLNATLQPRQIKFLIARELGYQALGVTERSRTSTPDQVRSFQQVLNDFRASYFGGALLMPRGAILSDLRTFFARTTWDGQPLLDMLTRFDVTPEMLLYRFSELIPEHFGLRLHFLRFHHVGDNYRLIKQLHMNNLMSPSGIGLHEYHCQRWLSGRLLRDLAAASASELDADVPFVGVQKSEFLESQECFLCMGFARPLVLQPEVGSSVVVGFQVTPSLSNTIRFIEDAAIPRIIINETCERCPLMEDQCTERGAPPIILQQRQKNTDRKAALQQLMAELKS